MTRRKGGIRKRSRRKLAKHVRRKGKISITNFFASFNANDKVALLAEPAIQKGMYNSRFHGKIGTIKGKRGRCYEVEIKDGSARKTLIVHPIHLKRLQYET